MQNKKTLEYREIFPYAVSPFRLLYYDLVTLSLLFFIFFGFAEVSLSFILIFLSSHSLPFDEVIV